MQTGTWKVKTGLAQMLKGGVIMDVVTTEHAKIAEDAGACAVMALERVPADIRAAGGVARMADPTIIEAIMKAVSIPVMAKCRIGHFVEAQALEALGVDYIDESEVLTPADESFHVWKRDFKVPFVCGCRDLGEALRRIHEGAAMIRTKGEAGTGNIVEAVRHMRAVTDGIKQVADASDDGLKELAAAYRVPVELVGEVKKLGKLPVRKDKRTLRLSTILRALPSIPNVWDYDTNSQLPIPTPVFANDQKGDCVISGRGHFTLRFEGFEQKKILDITDDDVLAEYWKEGEAEWGGVKPANGLLMLDSLKTWRKDGWVAAGQNYDIYAFSSIDWKNHNEVMAAIYLLTGVYYGMALPNSAVNQLGKIWTVTTGSDAQPGSWGLHCLSSFAYTYLTGVSEVGLVAVTWGLKQQMTWEFWDKYVDECYAIVDDRDKFLGDASPIDVGLLDQYLQDITEGNVPTPEPPPQPSPCKAGNGICRVLNIYPKLAHRQGEFRYMNWPEKKKEGG